MQSLNVQNALNSNRPSASPDALGRNVILSYGRTGKDGVFMPKVCPTETN